MKQLFTFHQTVQGYLHIMKNMPCQDSSASYSDPNGAYHIAVIADGHGDRACFRSKTGSDFVATAAITRLKEFADGFMGQEQEELPEAQSKAQPEYLPGKEATPEQPETAEETAPEQPEAAEETAPEQSEAAEETVAEPTVEEAAEAVPPGYVQVKAQKLDEQIESHEAVTGYSANPSADLPEEEKLPSPTRNQKWMMRRLIDAIYGEWRKKIREHYEQNPPTEEELNGAGAYANYYRAGKHWAHIYGTTLIAALWIDKYLILMQQGDGRCDVFYEDGTVDQPIPWDERCYENVTTSMCDDDAQNSMRYCIIDTSRKPVIACFMGSDGVEDSYADMEGTHMFYRELCCDLLEKGENIEDYLLDTLPDFSTVGSGDDVSVSGIVDMEAIAAYQEQFASMTKKYHMRDELMRLNSKITSMSRKHGILKKRWDDAKTELEAVAPRLDKLKKHETALKAKLAMKRQTIEEVEQAFDTIRKDQGELDTIEELMESMPPETPTESSIDMPVVDNAPTYEKRAEAAQAEEEYLTSQLADDPDILERPEAPAAAEVPVPEKKMELGELIAIGAKGIGELIRRKEWRTLYREELPYLVQEFRERFQAQFNVKQKEQDHLAEEIAELENQLHALQQEITMLQEQHEPMQRKAEEAKKAFVEYDKEYQDLNQAYRELEMKMDEA